MKQHLLSLMTAAALTVALTLTGGCANRKRATGVEGPAAVPANSFAREWENQLDLGSDAVSELHLRDDVLFVYTRNNLVHAVGSKGGEERYLCKPDVSGGVLRPPLLLPDYVVYPCGSTIDVFNHRGKAMRTITLEKPTRSPAIGHSNTIYIGLDHTGGTGALASIDVTRAYKVINWELMTFGAVSPTPALFDRIVYAGSEDGRIYAVTEERLPVWSLPESGGVFKTQGKFVSDIVVDEFGVFASNTDSKIYCLDRLTGRIKWQYYAGAALKTAPVVTSTMVYQIVDGVGIVAVDKANGTFNRAAKWQQRSIVQVLSEDEKNVYVLRDDKRLLALNKLTGETVFMSARHPFEIFTTNTKDSTIYGATRDGRLWAIRPVLSEGKVGTMVMDLRFEPIALAQ